MTQAETGKVSLAALEIPASNTVNKSGLLCWMVRNTRQVILSPQAASQPRGSRPRMQEGPAELSGRTKELTCANC